MKKGIIIFAAILLAAAAFSGCAQADMEKTDAYADEQNVNETRNDTNEVSAQAQVLNDGYGAKGALADGDVTLEAMLIYALQDEYLARAEYELIMNECGDIKPFVNIEKAERKHISELLPLFDIYGVDVPSDESSAHVVLPQSLLEAGETGVQAEIDNIAMYEAFLKRDLPNDVRDVFEALKSASGKHLEAFERLVRREA